MRTPFTQHAAAGPNTVGQRPPFGRSGDPATGALVFTLIVLGSLGRPARAAEPPRPVCGRNEVLDVVADDIAGRGLNAVILPGSIGQVPTALPDTVRCAVWLQTTFFDTNRFGGAPQVRLSVLDYTVRAGRNGLFVDVTRDPR